jgi:hypothetical protein
MPTGRVKYGSWLLRVAGWDGLLPAYVVLAPTAVELLIPNNPGAVELTAVVLPIAAFVVRYNAGKRHIASHNCSRVIRAAQFCVFCVGIALLVLIDAVLMLSHLMPQGALFAAREDRIVWAVLFSVYVTAMTIAMYPGRAESSAVG